MTVSSECSVEDINEPLEASAPSAAIGQKLDIKAKSVILMEPVTGKVLYEDNQDEKTPPASITKIMSLLLVMEAIDRKDISLETVVTASEHASSMGGSQIWLKEGEVMTVDELLRASFIASANDACAALAELVAGSETAFVQMMNDRAAELSMKDTYFENCTGLDDDTEKHLTSAYDIAIMSRELLKHKWVTRYSTVWMDTLRDGATELTNTNKLVRFYEGTTGLKTGTTSKAGSCLSASAERNGTHLLAVVMGAPTSDVRFADAKALLNWGFANYTAVRLAVDPSLVVPVNVRHSTVKSVMPEICGEKKALVEQKYKDGIEQKITLPVDVEAPVSKKQVLGKVEFFANNELIGTVNLVSPIEIVEISFFDAVISFLGSLSK